MKYTSAEANKLFKQLKEEEELILAAEKDNKTFFAAVGEDLESVRPDYNFHDTQRRLEQVRQQIRTVKHAINLFNVTTEVEPGMTIDEVLVALPQLTERQNRLRSMMMEKPKDRSKAFGMGSASVIDYKYTNYDPADAREAYHRVSNRLDELQLELDKVNTTIKFDINI